MRGFWARSISATVCCLALAGCMVVEKPPIDIDKSVKRRVAAGMSYLQDAQPNEARRHFSRALELDSGSAEAHNAMALLYKYEGDAEREEYHLRRAIRADRDYAVARNNYGSYLYSQGEYRKALKQFDRAANNPTYENRSIAFANKGRSLAALERYDEAVEAFDLSLRLNTDNVEALFEIARIYYQQQEFKRADQVYQEYEDSGVSQSARALWFGIQLATRLGDKDRLASYELALAQMYPDSTEYQRWRAWVDGGRQQ